MQAVGSYIQILRKHQGMTANDLAFATGLNVTYIWRIESGETEDPGLQRISKIVEAVKGRGDHIVKLLLHPAPSDAYVQELAREAQLSDDQRARAASLMTTDDDVRTLLEAVYAKAADPALRNRIRGYVDSLSSGDAIPPSPKLRQSGRRRRGE